MIVPHARRRVYVGIAGAQQPIDVSDAHVATEWYENTEGALGIVQALLVTAAMAEMR
jgi:hypothetical protein